MDWISLITGLVGVFVGGGIMFYRQNKAAKVIANESALSAEWEKLYREQKEARERNDERIRQLTQRVFELEQKVSQLEIEKNELKNNKTNKNKEDK